MLRRLAHGHAACPLVPYPGRVRAALNQEGSPGRGRPGEQSSVLELALLAGEIGSSSNGGQLRALHETRRNISLHQSAPKFAHREHIESAEGGSLRQ